MAQNKYYVKIRNKSSQNTKNDLFGVYSNSELIDYLNTEDKPSGIYENVNNLKIQKDVKYISYSITVISNVNTYIDILDSSINKTYRLTGFNKLELNNIKSSYLTISSDQDFYVNGEGDASKSINLNIHKNYGKVFISSEKMPIPNSTLEFVTTDGSEITLNKYTYDGNIEYLTGNKFSNLKYGFLLQNYCPQIKSINGLDKYDANLIINAYAMFYGCSSLTTLDLSNFNPYNVTNMGSMFESCSSLTTLDLSNFDTSNVTDMDAMFENCSLLTTLDLSNFDTSNVTDMGRMFENCSSLTTLDLSNFNTYIVTHMFYMFYGCSSLTTLDLSNFDTSNVTDMDYMFYNCNKLSSIKCTSKFYDWLKTNSSKCKCLDNMINTCKYELVDTKEIKYGLINGTTTPSISTTTPSISTTTPSISTTTPSISTTTPSISTTTPSISTTTPSISTTTKSINNNSVAPVYIDGLYGPESNLSIKYTIFVNDQEKLSDTITSLPYEGSLTQGISHDPSNGDIKIMFEFDKGYMYKNKEHTLIKSGSKIILNSVTTFYYSKFSSTTTNSNVTTNSNINTTTNSINATKTSTTKSINNYTTPPITIEYDGINGDSIDCDLSFEVKYKDGTGAKTVKVTKVPYINNLLDGLVEDKGGFIITPTYSTGSLRYGDDKTELKSGELLQITSQIKLYYHE